MKCRKKKNTGGGDFQLQVCKCTASKNILSSPRREETSYNIILISLSCLLFPPIAFLLQEILCCGAGFLRQGKQGIDQSRVIVILKRKSVGNQKDNTRATSTLLLLRYIEEGLKHYRSHAEARESGKRLAHSATFMVASIPGLCQSLMFFGLIQKI